LIYFIPFIDFSHISNLNFIHNFGSLFVFIFSFTVLLGVISSYAIHKKARGRNGGNLLTRQELKIATDTTPYMRRRDPFYIKLGAQAAVNKTSRDRYKKKYTF